MPEKKPYDQRTDIERIQSQWHKLTGLHTREEWSAAIVRAATAAEIAANYAIRRRFGEQSTFDANFVDGQLRWANGIVGKIDRLLMPLFKGTPDEETVKPLKAAAEVINRHRNEIVHSGEFRDEDEATAVIEQAKVFIETLVRIYDPTFNLEKRKQ
jgi:hypothetical protein